MSFATRISARTQSDMSGIQRASFPPSRSHPPEPERQEHQPLHRRDARAPLLHLEDLAREYDVDAGTRGAEQLRGAPGRHALERRIHEVVELLAAQALGE